MKRLVLLLASALLTACGGSGGGSGSELAPAPTPGPVLPAPTVVSVSMHRGTGFQCFTYGTALFCKGFASNPDLKISSTNYEVRALATNGMTALLTADDTLCFQTTVSERPHSRTAGTASYCFGEASLNVRAEPVVYSPPYAHGTNGTASVSYAPGAPFAGADLSLSQLSAQTAFGDYIITDGASSASVVSENCDLLNNVLTCSGFTAQVQ